MSVKSTFINKVQTKSRHSASDKPGITRLTVKTIDTRPELLDTPCIHRPRIEARGRYGTGRNRRHKRRIIDPETLAANIMLALSRLYPQSIENA
jgi:ribosome biogenesis GTPase A